MAHTSPKRLSQHQEKRLLWGIFLVILPFLVFGLAFYYIYSVNNVGPNAGWSFFDTVIIISFSFPWLAVFYVLYMAIVTLFLTTDRMADKDRV